MRKLTTEEFIKRSKSIHGDRYDYSLANYVGSRTKVDIICQEHGAFKQGSHEHINRGQGCPACKGENIGNLKRKTEEEIIKNAILVHNNKYDYSLVEYKNNKTYSGIICPTHGIFWQRMDAHIWQAQGCPKCSNNNFKRTKEEFVDQSNLIHKNKYDYSLVEYINNHTKVKIICRKHGKFLQKPLKHINSEHGCPKCSSSKGEMKVEDWLRKSGVEFVSQYTFPDLKDKALLKFDFFLPEHNALIEYDGAQHYSPRRNESNMAVRRRQFRDKMKDQYCLENNIKLLRIPYWQFNAIEKILSNFITNLPLLRLQ